MAGKYIVLLCMKRPHFHTPYSEGCFRRNSEESVGLESLHCQEKE